jgi:hypothetical protein
LGRSRPGARRSPAAPSSLEPAPPVPSLASATLPRVWQGVGYRPLSDAGTARPLFDFAAVGWPSRGPLEIAWGAFGRDASAPRDTLLGAVLGERAGDALMLHGPVVATVPRGESMVRDPLEVATQLVAAALDHATAAGVETVFARPQGLDRVWVRFGFIPIPESALPERLSGGPAVGLYAWRGGSALWSFRERREDAPVRRDTPPTPDDRG